MHTDERVYLNINVSTCHVYTTAAKGKIIIIQYFMYVDAHRRRHPGIYIYKIYYNSNVIFKKDGVSRTTGYNNCILYVRISSIVNILSLRLLYQVGAHITLSLIPICTMRTRANSRASWFISIFTMNYNLQCPT
jgi:hypothetical protein